MTKLHDIPDLDVGYKKSKKSKMKEELLIQRQTQLLKSLGPIDRKFHGHGENDGFVLYEHIIK